MNRVFCTLVLIVGLKATLLGASPVPAEPFLTLKMLKQVPDGIPGEEEYNGIVDVGDGIKLPFNVEVTVRRNGSLKLANLWLRIIDEYDDGQLYEDGLLTVAFADLEGKGHKSIIKSGLVVHTGEKETDPRTWEAVVFIYRFDPAKKEFSRVYKHASFDLEI